MAYLTSGRNKIMGSSVSTDANVVTVIDDTCTDEQVPSALATKAYVDNKEVKISTEENNKIETKDDGIFVSKEYVEITQDEYDLLTEEEKEGIVFYIIDATGTRGLTTVIDENSTDEQIPTAKAVYDKCVTEDKITDALDNNSTIDQIPNANLVASEIHGKYFDIADYSDAMAMPIGKWRVDSNNKASQMQNLPVPKAGILEVKYLQGNDGNTAYTGAFKYAMLTYTAISGEKYERSFNSDNTVGNIVNDTGWKTVITENSETDLYSCTGYKKLTGTEDLFTLSCGHYVTEKANTAYNYPITDTSTLTAHIYVLGHLNDPSNNKGYRIILYFDNKNRMYRINEWWGVFTDNGWQNMQSSGNSTNYSKRSFSINSWSGYSSGNIYYQSVNGICYITVSDLCILSGEKTNSTQLPAGLVPATDVAQNLIDNNGKIIGRITIAEGNRTLIVKHLSANAGDNASLTFSYPIKTS